MNRMLKIILFTGFLSISILILLLGYYFLSNRQTRIKHFEYGHSNADNKILIASQGSDFKHALVKDILKEFHSDSLYFSIVDCAKLDEENIKDWDACIIIHTIEAHKMPKSTRRFLGRLKDFSKILLVSTSGSGNEKIKDLNIDAVSTASYTKSNPLVIDWLKPKLIKILESTP